MKIAIAQVNLMLGDLVGNVDRLVAEANKARDAGAALIVTPELALCGYPPEDLLMTFRFVTPVPLLSLSPVLLDEKSYQAPTC